VLRLKEAGVETVNHNLNTSANYTPEIVSTHTFEDRVNTVEAVKKAGMKTCSGGILGMGESDDDVIDLALSLRELDVKSVPVNFLIPVPGTSLEGVRNSIRAAACAFCRSIASCCPRRKSASAAAAKCICAACR
jgi:biotin synthase